MQLLKFNFYKSHPPHFQHFVYLSTPTNLTKQVALISFYFTSISDRRVAGWSNHKEGLAGTWTELGNTDLMKSISLK